VGFGVEVNVGGVYGRLLGFDVSVMSGSNLVALIVPCWGRFR